MVRRFWMLSVGERIQLAVEALTITLLGVFAVMPFGTTWIESLMLLALGLILAILAQERLEAVLLDDQVRRVAPKDRQAQFNLLTASPPEWMFWGGLGRWFRSVAVPAVAEAATSQSPVRAVLLDPRDEVSCRADDIYRKRSGWYGDHTLQARGVQAEVLATVGVMLLKQSETRIRAEVGFITTYSPRRVDANGETMLVTTPDRKHSPLKVQRTHWYYDVVTDEVMATIENGPVVRFPELAGEIDPGDPGQIAEALARVMVFSRAEDGERPLLSGYAEDGVDWELVVEAMASKRVPDRENRAS